MKQLSPNLLNWTLAVQWYFPQRWMLSASWTGKKCTRGATINLGTNTHKKRLNYYTKFWKRICEQLLQFEDQSISLTPSNERTNEKTAFTNPRKKPLSASYLFLITPWMNQVVWFMKSPSFLSSFLASLSVSLSLVCASFCSNDLINFKPSLL